MASTDTVDLRSRGCRCRWAQISLRITLTSFVRRHATVDAPAASVLGSDVADVAPMDVLSLSDLRQTQTGNVLGHQIQSANPNLLQMRRLRRAIFVLQ